MCLDFELEYSLYRAEQARRAMQEADEKRKQAKAAVPPKPAESDAAREQGEPVPV